jgi:RimJ/RimL family protein N-acetyltransferase
MAPYREEHTLEDGRVLLIREAIEDDAQAIVEHCERIGGETDFLSYGQGEFGITVDEERVFIREYPLRGNVLMVGLVDGELASVANVERVSLRERLIHAGALGITVQKAFWGCGIGMGVMRALVDWSRQAGLQKLNLEVYANNERAIAMYKRLGFEREGRNRRSLRLGDSFVDGLWMGLLL